MAAAGLLTGIPDVLLSRKNARMSRQGSPDEAIWSYFIHLSYNMWEDHIPEEYRDKNYPIETCMDARRWAHGYRPELTFDDELWDTLLEEIAAAGMNMVVIDLGDGVQYESHPEIAVRNAWSTAKLRDELARMRKMGLEPIPKMNFSASHDVWLSPYDRMVSTQKYYDVCRDLIAEVSELFDKPRFFHLGMDEEHARNQRYGGGTNPKYVTIRRDELYWGDFYFLIGEVEKNGSRAWIFSDYVWHHPEVFYKKMPRSVLQSNSYYRDDFKPDDLSRYFDGLDKHGYDQVPCGSIYNPDRENFGPLVEYCKGVIDPARLYGFLIIPWKPTLMPCYDIHKEAIDQVAAAIRTF
jgi:hypothetical protein